MFGLLTAKVNLEHLFGSKATSLTAARLTTLLPPLKRQAKRFAFLISILFASLLSMTVSPLP
jgi:hypothetical protein